MILPERRPKVNKAEIYRLIDSGRSQGAVARQIGVNQSYISRLLKHRRLHALPTNGDHSASQRIDSAPTLPQRVEMVGEPVSDAPAHQSALQRIDPDILREYDSRIAVLEAFMAAQQQLANAPQRIIASAHPNASQRTAPVEWVNRGTHLAADMIARVKAYAQEHRLEMREVIDLALRRFFAGEGGNDA